MKFSEYVRLGENEEEIDMNVELTKVFLRVKDSKLKKFLTQNITSFAIKNADIKKLNPEIQYHKNYEPILLAELSRLKTPFEITTKSGKTFILTKNIIFRQTGKAIESYWGSSNAGNKTNNQEIGVGIWVLILSNGGSSLEDFAKLRLDSKMVCDNKEDIKKALDFLASSSKTPNGWNQQCKTSAEAVIENLGNLINYQVHQGGPFFNSLRTLGSKLSDLHKDKWNPSDIYLIKGTKYKDILNSKSIEELNSKLNEFNDIIGISLKGAQAIHGAASLTTIFKKLKLKDPNTPEWKIKVNSKLTPEQKIKLKSMLKTIKNQSSKCDFKVGLFLSDKSKMVWSDDINELIDNIVISSPNWGKSIPITLDYLCSIKTTEQWNKFIFRAYCVASSKTFESASYYKVDGNGHFEKCVPGLDEKKFKCSRRRIDIDGTSVVFDAEYDGNPLKLQFRSKQSRPQMSVIHTSENPKIFKELKQLKNL